MVLASPSSCGRFLGQRELEPLRPAAVVAPVVSVVTVVMAVVMTVAAVVAEVIAVVCVSRSGSFVLALFPSEPPGRVASRLGA